MKVHLIRRTSVVKFMTQHARSRSSMYLFLQLLKEANWEIPNDIKSTFGKRVDTICNGKRVVFDVGGGVFRIICGLAFRKKSVFLFVKFIGTHSEYEKLCNAGKNEIGICDVDLYKSK
ncbi:MAG: type II toxin-antitoxin system HigB family toxin [Chitinophagales bacterium]